MLIRFLLPCLALSLAAQDLSLPAALRQAGQSSLQADLAGLANQGAAQERKEIQATYLPEVHLQGGHLNLAEKPALKSEPFQLGPFAVPSLATPLAQKSSWRYSLTADYLVYDFGKRAKAVSASKAKEQAVELRGRDAVSRAQAEVAARYLAVQNLKARQRVVAQRRQALLDHLKDAQALFAQGVVARNDLLRTEVALRTVDDAERALGNALRAATESLNVALGVNPETPRSFPASLGAPPALPWDEAQARQRAAQANQGVRALGSKVAASEDQVAYRKQDSTPNVVAQVGHSYEENQFLLHPQQTTLYLGVSWKLFDGGARAARVSQARAEADSARRELLEAQRQAGSAAAAAHRAFQEALQEMTSAQANVDAALENLRIVRDQYQQGYAKGADVLDAETVLAESRFSLADRHCRAFTQQAALLALLGEDLAAFYDRNLEH